MPPKRKSAVAARSSKRLKTSESVVNASDSLSKTRWEWEDDGNKWVVFSSAFSAEIEKACKQKKPKILLSLPSGTKLEVIFHRMVQRNKTTGWERKIRIAVQADDTDYYCWHWEDEYGKLQSYQYEHVAALETALQNDEKSCEIEIAGNDYVMDFSKWSQENKTTGTKRSIKRVKSDAPAPGDGSEKDASEESDEEMPDKSLTSKKGISRKTGKSGGKSNGVKSAGGKSAASTSKSKQEAKSTMRKIVMKGKAPVDPECSSKVETAHVYCEGKDVWDCMLNQTNLQFNNNKYYLIQLLEDDARKAYSVWQRWGRVGKPGQNNLVPCGSNLDQAKKVFCKKFSDKTKNDWADRDKFVKVAGKYDLMQMDYSAGDTEDKKSISPTSSIDVPDSKLDDKLQALIQLICDVKSMEDAVVEMQYDSKKAPLGKLNPDQIKAGYEALKEISEIIENGQTSSKHAALLQACNDFYTRIPHDFGMKVPPIIRTKQEVKQKIQLIEALGDIEIALKLIKEGSADENPVDSHYKSLKCELNALNKTDADYKMIEDYMLNTHAATHNHYRMKILDLFAVNKEGDENFNDVGNRMLLWHGSRLTNWVGILSQGLRIAPPEAPVTGYMFGKGVYFADMSSKSANYCFTSRAKNVGLVLLSEVALGNTHDLLAADYKADKLPAGKHSVKGVGAVAPDPSKHFTMPDGTIVPLGKAINTGVKNPAGYTLNYNEFIVYDTRQIRMRYLVKVQFDYK